MKTKSVVWIRTRAPCSIFGIFPPLFFSITQIDNITAISFADCLSSTFFPPYFLPTARSPSLTSCLSAVPAILSCRKEEKKTNRGLWQRHATLITTLGTIKQVIALYPRVAFWSLAPLFVLCFFAKGMQKVKSFFFPVCSSLNSAFHAFILLELAHQKKNHTQMYKAHI